jgi:hypothetical protein
VKKAYQGRYLYCVIKGMKKKTFGTGFEGNPVYTIPYRDLSAVVSDVPQVEYEPNTANALIHEEVVERVMQGQIVLPLSFGNVFVDENRVKWLLANSYQIFKAHIEKLEGKAEVGVKVLYEAESKQSEEKAYEYGVKVYEALKKHADETRLMRRIGGNMILNTSFLIQRDGIQEFKTELEKLEKEYADKGLKFQFSGPWPPYNFVQIRVGR